MGSFVVSKKTLEINPEHAIIVSLRDNPSGKHVKDLIWLLYETALLTSGFTLEEPTSFAKRIHRMVALGLSITEEPTGDEGEEEMPDLEDGDDGAMEEVD